MRNAKTIVLSLLAVILTACGGGGGSVGNPKPAPTVTLTATPTTGMVGDKFAVSIATSDATSCTGSDGLSGITVPLNGTVTTVQPTTAGSPKYTATCTGAGGSTSATVTLTVNAVVGKPTATLAANPTTLTSGGTTVLTWTCTNATTCTASSTDNSWTGAVASGSAQTATVTPAAVSAATTVTYTLTATGSGGTTTATANVTVNPIVASVPNITSLTPPVIYCDAECLFIPVTVNGNGFAEGKTVTTHGFFPDTTMPAGTTPTSPLYSYYNFDTDHYSPGWIPHTACNNSNLTGCGTTSSLAFIGNHNVCATYPKTGEKFCLDQGLDATTGKRGYVRKFKADGTADGSFSIGGLYQSITVDDITGFVIVGGGFILDQNGNFNDVPLPAFSSTDNPKFGVAKNGWGCFVDTTANRVGCYDLTGGVASRPTIHYANVGSQPFAAAMAVSGSETDLYPLSRDGTPTLWKVNVSGGTTVTGSEPIPGITPVAAIPASNTVAGWHVVAFDNGTVAVFAAADKLLAFVNSSTMKVSLSATLSGVPFRIAAEGTTGNVIVAYADSANTLTTFTRESPSGTSTKLSSTMDILAVGFESDGTNLYGFSRKTFELKPNK